MVNDRFIQLHAKFFEIAYPCPNNFPRWLSRWVYVTDNPTCQISLWRVTVFISVHSMSQLEQIFITQKSFKYEVLFYFLFFLNLFPALLLFNSIQIIRNAWVFLWQPGRNRTRLLEWGKGSVYYWLFTWLNWNHCG